MSNHTPTPWIAVGSRVYNANEAAGWISLPHPPIPVAQEPAGRKTNETTRANAERIVAAVNFCDGFTNEELAAFVSLRRIAPDPDTHPLTHLCREDFEGKGYDVSQLTDIEIGQLTSEVWDCDGLNSGLDDAIEYVLQQWFEEDNNG